MKKTMLLGCALVGLALVGSANIASADYQVYVGYADGLRGGGFFPNPWSGDPNVEWFLGDNTTPDAGAVLVWNTGASAITLTDAKVDNFDTGAVFQIWGSQIGGGLSLDPGKYLILTQNAGENFDTSDQNFGSQAFPSSTVPKVHLTFDGVTGDFADTGLVLNTGGFDFATIGNESHQWRPIGTFGGPSGTGVGVPEPGTVALLAAGALTFGGLIRRRRARK